MRTTRLLYDRKTHKHACRPFEQDDKHVLQMVVPINSCFSPVCSHLPVYSVGHRDLATTGITTAHSASLAACTAHGNRDIAWHYCCWQQELRQSSISTFCHVVCMFRVKSDVALVRARLLNTSPQNPHTMSVHRKRDARIVRGKII